MNITICGINKEMSAWGKFFFVNMTIICLPVSYWMTTVRYYSAWFLRSSTHMVTLLLSLRCPPVCRRLCNQTFAKFTKSGNFVIFSSILIFSLNLRNWEQDKFKLWLIPLRWFGADWWSLENFELIYSEENFKCLETYRQRKVLAICLYKKYLLALL